MAQFILSDNSVNESGFRVLTSGIDISQFKKNPQMFWNHHRSSDYSADSKLLPIGIWTNIKKEDDKLLAEPEFDMEDDFAAKVAKKVDKKHLKATSIGFKIIEVSTDPKHLVKGQTRPTVTRCRLMETSIVDLPRNGNALRLYFVGEEDSDNMLELGAEGSIEKLNEILPLINSTNNTEMKNVFNFLKLGDAPSEADVLAAITILANGKNESELKIASLESDLEKLKNAQEEGRCEALISKAIADKKLTESQRGAWMNIAKNSYEDALKAIEGMTGFNSLSGNVDTTKDATTKLGDAAKYEAKWKSDELVSWKNSNPEEFERCENAYLAD